MSRLSIPRRYDRVGVPRHRLANVVAATHVIGSVCRLSTWLLEPLLPLLTCCLLALFSASIAAAMRSETDGPLLGENGSLVNFTSARRLLHEVKPPLTAATTAKAPAAAAAKAVSSVASAEAPPTGGCPVLTFEAVEQMCTALTSDQLPSLSSAKAAHRLNHCDIFDFRHLIVHADSLMPSSEEHNCSLLLLSAREREGMAVDKLRCVSCLKALIAADDHVAGMAQLFSNLLDKYQCYMQNDTPLPSLLSTSSSISSSASNRRRNASGEVEPANKAPLNTNHVRMTPQTHPGASNCEACRIAYRGWLCTKKFIIYPFSTVSEMPLSQRFQPQPACSNWCAAVETNCPYFTPGEDQQNGGEPVFLCDEAHYHHSSHYRVPSDPCEQDSRRHSCCYLRQDTDCRPSNKTCPPLKKVCFPQRVSVSAAPNSTLNTSTSPPASQQQQYLAQPQNATLDPDNATSPASGASGAARTVSNPLLLLTAFLIFESCRRELT